jgi:hypothetical protein
MGFGVTGRLEGQISDFFENSKSNQLPAGLEVEYQLGWKLNYSRKLDMLQSIIRRIFIQNSSWKLARFYVIFIRFSWFSPLSSCIFLPIMRLNVLGKECYLSVIM